MNSSKKILVIGKSGQIAQSLSNIINLSTFKNQVLFLDRSNLDLSKTSFILGQKVGSFQALYCSAHGNRRTRKSQHPLESEHKAYNR